MSRLLRFVAPAIPVALLAFCALTACTTTRTVYVDRPVEVERTRWVPIDPGLTARKPIPEPRTDSGREVLRVASERKADLKACYADKASIEAVQGTEVTP
jgi:hypothetical protein